MTTSLTVYPSAIEMSNLKDSDKWNNVLRTRNKNLLYSVIGYSGMLTI